ncbi:cytochrome d ubiquinol oxidase subunit II [Lolliginicoccus suaedae]|uniref:cytochrome d ubiquinol oxidase subunit II n=1 Tax=Lolliginicoccus suaedae TaxID=2605429 RepID=UPI0011F04E29|nr:cytochrome d ubiquinol oxidase subunit II [Lolliginicoccus suaedae]
MPAPGLDEYLDDLVIALQVRKVPHSTIHQIVAEVEGKASSTGTPPAELFGPPRAHADKWGKDPRWPWWAKTVAVVLMLAFAAGSIWLAQHPDMVLIGTLVAFIAPFVIFVAWAYSHRARPEED